MRVLLVKTSSLGDVLHTLPALSDARAAIPTIRFDWVVEEAFAEVPAWHPAVARSISVAIRRWRKNPWSAARDPSWRAFREDLRGQHYDVILDAQGLMKTAWITALATGPTHGLDRRSAREWLASCFYKHSHRVPFGQPATDRLRQLFALTFGYDVPHTPPDHGLGSRLSATVTGRRKRVVFAHGTAWPTKRWPTRHWRRLAERFIAADWEVVIPSGSDDERARAEQIGASLPQVHVLPRMTLDDLRTYFENADRAVCVDTGLAHLAAAVGTPTDTLFGASDPELTTPTGNSRSALVTELDCAPCLSKRCRIAKRPPTDLGDWPPCMASVDPDSIRI